MLVAIKCVNIQKSTIKNAALNSAEYCGTINSLQFFFNKEVILSWVVVTLKQVKLIHYAKKLTVRS